MKDQDSKPRICVATVTTDSYLPGTLVALHSFLTTNQWFDGDIRIISQDLNSESRELLSLLYERIIFEEVSDELLQRVNGIADVFKDFERRHIRFFSLEAFRFKDYDKVLILDSDVLFRGSVLELFDFDEALVAAGDGAFYHDKSRPWAIDMADPAREPGLLSDTFNAGVMVAGNDCIKKGAYQGILSLLDKRVYGRPNIRLADQVILNIYFSGQVRIVSGAYNYLMVHHEAIYQKEKIALDSAKVWHFNGQHKPWEVDKLVAQPSNPDYLQCCDSWLTVYNECMEQTALNSRRLRGTDGI